MADVDFNWIRNKCADLEKRYSQRNDDDDEIERMYLMEWTAPDDERLTVTISPAARNAAKGAIRLLTAASPLFSVPYDKNNAGGRKASDLIEKAASAIWYQSCRATQRLHEREGMTTATLFDEIHIGVTMTADLVEAAANDPVNRARMERLAAMTPIVFEVYDPRTGFPEFDQYGLASYYRKVEVMSGELLDRWGEAAIAAGLNPRQRDEKKYYCDYWDSLYHVAWIEGSSSPLFAAEHNLPCIPIVCQLVDGSTLHDADYQRQGLLYTLYKSGLWERANLLLTIMYSNVLGIGANPMFQGTTEDPSNPPRPDYSIPGGTMWMRRGDTWGAVQRNVIDQSLLTSYNLGAQEIEASTIFNQALGQPLGGGNAPFSSVALLNQAGRLPLTALQKLGGAAIGKAMEIALLLLKSNGKKQTIRAKGASVINLTASDIPDDLIIDCKLDISLPTDDRQNAMVAAQLTGGQNPIVSRRWARENLLGVGQSEDMQKEIMEEAFVDAKMQIALQQKIQQAQMEAQAKMQPAQPPAQPPTQPAVQGSPSPMPEGNMPPEMPGAGLPAMPMTAPETPQGMPGEPVPPGQEMMM